MRWPGPLPPGLRDPGNVLRGSALAPGSSIRTRRKLSSREGPPPPCAHCARHRPAFIPAATCTSTPCSSMAVLRASNARPRPWTSTFSNRQRKRSSNGDDGCVSAWSRRITVTPCLEQRSKPSTRPAWTRNPKSAVSATAGLPGCTRSSGGARAQGRMYVFQASQGGVFPGFVLVSGKSGVEKLLRGGNPQSLQPRRPATRDRSPQWSWPSDLPGACPCPLHSPAAYPVRRRQHA